MRCSLLNFILHWVRECFSSNSLVCFEFHFCSIISCSINHSREVIVFKSLISALEEVEENSCLLPMQSLRKQQGPGLGKRKPGRSLSAWESRVLVFPWFLSIFFFFSLISFYLFPWFFLNMKVVHEAGEPRLTHRECIYYFLQHF